MLRNSFCVNTRPFCAPSPFDTVMSQAATLPPACAADVKARSSVVR